MKDINITQNNSTNLVSTCEELLMILLVPMHCSEWHKKETGTKLQSQNHIFWI